jgi:hypothetical protein
MTPAPKQPEPPEAVASAPAASATPNPPAAAFDPNLTQSYQSKMPAAPVWVSSMLAGTSREKSRLRVEVSKIKGAVPLLMKQRNGGRWTTEDKNELKTALRSASSVSPYLFIWVLPGSMLLLPFLAWHLDTRRKRRSRRNAPAPAPDIDIS